MPHITESARDVPVTDHFDVVVCGGGPAGTAAAIAAAKQGARTALLEAHGSLGGIWTTGLMAWILDARNKGGFLQELYRQLHSRGMARQARGNYICDVEGLKLLLEELCDQGQVYYQFHTRCCGSRVDAAGRLTHCVTESPAGREAWAADIFVDATGDGHLAIAAGCSWSYGKPDNGAGQPASLIAVLTGVEPEQFQPFDNTLRSEGASPKQQLLAELQRAGMTPSYLAPSLFHVTDDVYLFMANHQYGVASTDAQSMTRATAAARRELHDLVAALRALGEPWSRLRIVATGAQIGLRESRRVAGLYQVTLADMLAGRRHTDAVCRVTFNIDVHAVAAGPDAIEARGDKQVQPYDIPFRALVARDVDGLLLAGRCISGDFLAHSSYRVTGNAVPMGEAAGTAAALAVRQQCLPQELGWEAIARHLPPVERSGGDGAGARDGRLERRAISEWEQEEMV